MCKYKLIKLTQWSLSMKYNPLFENYVIECDRHFILMKGFKAGQPTHK